MASKNWPMSDGSWLNPASDLEDPIAPGCERLAVATNIGVCNASRLRRPDDGELRLNSYVSLEQLPRIVA